LETFGDHVVAALAWLLAGCLFFLLLLVKAGALDYDPELTEGITLEFYDNSR